MSASLSLSSQEAIEGMFCSCKKICCTEKLHIACALCDFSLKVPYLYSFLVKSCCEGGLSFLKQMSKFEKHLSRQVT